MNRVSRMLVIVALLGITAAPGWGQTTGSVEGIVVDQTGAAIPAVALKAKNVATGATLSATGDENGLFRFAVVPVGTYEITAEKSGFANVVQKNVVVTVGAKINLTLTMNVAAQVATVTVTEETPLVETTRTQVSTSVNATSISSLPVNGRNFIDFVLLTPGVTRDTRTGDISFAGQRGTLNSLTVDGSDNNNTFFGQTLGRTGSGRAPYQFSQDAVQEFQVNSNSYSAELGRAAGAVVNVVTKSGTNEMHGTAFWFYRDRRLNATDLIDRNNNRPKAAYHFNQFGGNLGGPILRDKLFFFFDYDGQRNTQPNTVFLILPTGFAATSANELRALAYLQARANSWIRTQDQNVILLKSDWQISPDHRFTGRWNRQRFTGGGFESGGAQNSFEHTGASLVLTDTLTFSLTSTLAPSVINQAQVTWLRDMEPGRADSNRPEATVRQSGATVLVVGRNFFSPRETTIKRWQGADTLSYVRGRHTYKVGVDIVADRILNFFPGNFSGGFTFSSLENFGLSLAGLPLPAGATDSLTQAFAGPGTSGPFTNPDLIEYAAFAQDEWRLENNITLTYGLRYDLQTVRQPDVLNPSASLAAAGIRTNRINVDSNNFGPRVGIAWSPWGEKNKVVRAGYGIFHGRTPSIMYGTAHSNNGINVQSRTFTRLTTPVIPSYPNNICGAPDPSGAPPMCAVPATVTGAAPIIFNFSNDYAQPYVQQLSAGFEWEFLKNWSVQLNYLGVKGTHLQRTRDANLNPSPSVNSITIQGTTDTLVFHSYSSTRPIAGFSRILQFESTANSIYHGATLLVNKRYSDNYQLVFAYTYGQVIDSVPDATAVVPGTFDDAKMVQYPTLPFSDRSVGVNDQRHRFVLSGIWSLDAYARELQPAVKAVLGGWEISWIYTGQSGQPFSGMVGSDLNNDGNSRSDRTPGSPRHLFRLPWTFSFDPRVTKNIKLYENLKLQLIGEAFNLFNRPNVFGVRTTEFARSTSIAAVPTGCGAPTGPLNPCLIPQSNFGAPTSTNFTPRIVQLAAKITF